MERLCIAVIYISIALASTTLAIPSDAGIYSRRLKLEEHRHRLSRSSTSEPLRKLKLQIQEGSNLKPQLKFLTVEPNAVTVNSPFSLPPFDSLAPTPLPVNSPPFCEDAPPRTPQPPPPSPPPAIPAPGNGIIYSHTPPPPALQPHVPARSLSPPPSSPSTIPMTPLAPLAPYPPDMSSPAPPSGPPSPLHHYGPSPPKHAPGPPSPSHGPSPPVFLPPMVLPPPSGPP
ncbi:pollen-specific leucine-rich repeat extensin-like protein 1, partial [Momordica charantia]|uniref:Pollen-specific leucine-rich repeat extensin-like protein 1 n=1 Tax=Momordica charantia TaxID=3673 RepID=A0A6J1CJG6_MOMCH